MDISWIAIHGNRVHLDTDFLFSFNKSSVCAHNPWLQVGTNVPKVFKAKTLMDAFWCHAF